MKILYVTTISNTINAFLIPHIEHLLDLGYEVDIACNIKREVCERLINRGCKIYNISFQRTPLSIKNYSAYKKIKSLIEINKYDIVHTHTPVASTVVRLACRRMKNIKIFYTAHGFHFYKGAPKKNWLVYFPIEYFLSKYTDVTITINEEDYNLAKKYFRSEKIEYIPGVGLNLNNEKLDFESIRNKKRNELGINENAIVILSVGELNRNKNHEIIIKALAKINNHNLHYVICGQGKLDNYLKKLIRKLDLSNQVKLLGFRNDVSEILVAADIFAFPSKREGLGMACLEAMASGLPIITSNIHGIKDYSFHGKNSYSFDSKDLKGFVIGISKLMKNPDLRQQMGRLNLELVKKYELNNVINKLSDIYKYG